MTIWDEGGKAAAIFERGGNVNPCRHYQYVRDITRDGDSLVLAFDRSFPSSNGQGFRSVRLTLTNDGEQIHATQESAHWSVRSVGGSWGPVTTHRGRLTGQRSARC